MANDTAATSGVDPFAAFGRQVRQGAVAPDMSAGDPFDSFSKERLDRQVSRAADVGGFRSQPQVPRLPADATYLNSEAGQDLLQRGLQNFDSLSAVEKKQIKQAREQFPEIDAAFSQAEALASEETEQQERITTFRQIAQAMGKASGQAMLEGRGEVVRLLKMFEAAASGVGEMISPTDAIKRLDVATGGVPDKQTMQQNLSRVFTEAGVTPVKPGDDYVRYDRRDRPHKGTHTVASAIATNLAVGAYRLGPELLAGLMDNPVDFAKGLITFVPETLSTILTALDVQSIPLGPSGAAIPLVPSDEEVEQARDELIANPLAVAMLGLIGVGLGRGRSGRRVSVAREAVDRFVKEGEGKVEAAEAKTKAAEEALATEKKPKPPEKPAAGKEAPPVTKEPPPKAEPKPAAAGEAADISKPITQTEFDAVTKAKKKAEGEITASEKQIERLEAAVKPEHTEQAKADVQRLVDEQRGIIEKRREIVAEAEQTLQRPVEKVQDVSQVTKPEPIVSKEVPDALRQKKAAEAGPEAPPAQKAAKVEVPDTTPPAEVSTGFETADAARNLGHAKAAVKVAEQALDLKTLTKEQRAKAESDLIANKELVEKFQAEVDRIKGKTEPKTPEIVGLSKAENAEIRARFNLDKLPEDEVRHFTESASEAKSRGLDRDALEIADQVLKAERPISTAEHAGMTLKATELIKEYERTIAEASDLIEKGEIGAAETARLRSEVTLDQLDKLTEATKLGRREAARTTSIGRMRVDAETYELAPTMQRARVAKGKKLTPKETATIEKVVKANSELETKLQALEKEFDATKAERDKLAAERETAREVAKAEIVSKAAKKTSANLADRADAKKRLLAIGFRVNEITGIGVEALYQVGRLASTYIKEGVNTLDAVVAAVRKDVPDLSARDVYEALNTRNPSKQAKARNEVQQRIGQMKTQARLLLEIEKAEKGVFDRPEGVKREPPPKAIRDLQKQLRKLRTEAYKSNLEASRLEKAIQKINELQDQLENQHRTLKAKRPIDPPELAAAKAKIAEIRKLMRTQDELARLNKQLETGEFEVRKAKVEEQVPEELDRLRVEVNLARRRIRSAVDDLSPVRGKRLFGEIANFNRATLASLDFSGWLRQNVIPVFSHPLKSIRQFKGSASATLSDFRAEKIATEINNRPQSYLYHKSALEIRELDGIVTKLEESFMSKLAEKIPIVGIIVRASNRNMLTLGNLIRTALFDDFLLKNPNATHAELTNYANGLNKMTGIGDLGQFAAAANALSLGFFAPKLAVSRVQAPLLPFKRGLSPRVRRQFARDLGGFVATGSAILGLASIWAEDNDDIEVGADPRESDWGKIRVGNTRIDIWGGFQQPARLIWRTGLGITDRIGISGQHLTKTEREFDYVEELTRFAQYKQAPFIGLTRSLLEGKTAVGEPVTVTEAFAKSLVPLILQDVRDAYKEAGFARAAGAGALAFFGVGVNTFEDSENRLQRDIKKAIADKDFKRVAKKQEELTRLRAKNQRRKAQEKRQEALEKARQR